MKLLQAHLVLVNSVIPSLAWFLFSRTASVGVFNTKFQIKFFGFLCSIFEMYFRTNMGNKEFFKGQVYGKMSLSPLANYYWIWLWYCWDER